MARDWTSLREQVEQRLGGLRTDRYSWWVHHRELAQYILPRRYKWLITPNQFNRGSILNQNIIDSTGTIAARTCAAGMMSGITSPTRPWFKLQLTGMDHNDENSPVSLWLSECEKRMMKVFSESNFYNAIATVYLDLVVFGTSAMLMYEDFNDVINCQVPCAGEYFLANDDRNFVDTIYREFSMTIAQVGAWFGKENCSPSVRQALEKRGADVTREVIVCHAIEPNTGSYGIPKHFKFREVYWEKSSDQKLVLRAKGFHELPGFGARWDLVSNDAYGRSPGMDALGDIKQLQQETKRKAQAIDKMVNPPMIADVQLKNQPASLLPGGVTYVSGQNNVGFKPVFTVMPPVQELMMDIKEIQERIKQIFFNDLFMMISNLQTVRTATEIDARREEKLVMLGPVLERFENEALDPAVTRTFNIMSRGGLLPPAPPEIHGANIDIQYVSMLSEAQRAVASSGIERILQLVGNIAAIDPSAPDNIDFDETIAEYSGLMGNPPKIVRDREAVAKLRDQRAKQQQQEQMLQQTLASVKGAQVLSQTDLGGGQNALSAMVGGGQQQ